MTQNFYLSATMFLIIIFNLILPHFVEPYGVVQLEPNLSLSRFRTVRQLGEPALSWRQISYNFGGSQNFLVSESFSRQDFIPYNNVPMGVSRWHNRLFITMPRRRPGIPSTLNILELSGLKTQMDLPLTPFPGGNRLVSVYRTTVDECNRLWMVDTGVLEYPGNQQRVQAPAVVVFNLLTNELLHRYELPSSVFTNTSNLAAITVDIPNVQMCNNVFAYIPDVAGYGLIVYDTQAQRSWRFSHNYFHQDPNGGLFQINDLRFEWDDGIFCVALGPRSRNSFRTAYFHAMASTHEYAVNTRVLRNESMASESFMADAYVYLGDKGARQNTAMSALHQETGVLFFGQVQIGGVACWNTKLPFREENFVVLFEDNEKFVYPSDMTIDSEGNLWVMTNTMPYFNYRQLNTRNVNFRVWMFNVRELIANTNCDAA